MSVSGRAASGDGLAVAGRSSGVQRPAVGRRHSTEGTAIREEVDVLGVCDSVRHAMTMGLIHRVGYPASSRRAVAVGVLKNPFLIAASRWLEHYAGFERHLRSRYACVQEDEHVVVFDLRREAVNPVT